MPYPMTDAERHYLAYDLPDDLARELFDGGEAEMSCSCPAGKPACIVATRSATRAAYLPVEIIGVALMVAFYAVAAHGVVEKIAELGTLLAS